MKRKLKWISVILSAVLLGFGAVTLLWPSDRITEASWRNIELGMTIEEVQIVLGSRGSTFEQIPLSERAIFTLDVPLFEEPWRDPFVEVNLPKVVWIGRNGVIEINVNGASRVVYKNFRERYNPTFLDRIRHWLGW